MCSPMCEWVDEYRETALSLDKKESSFSTFPSFHSFLAGVDK